MVSRPNRRLTVALPSHLDFALRELAQERKISVAEALRVLTTDALTPRTPKKQSARAGGKIAATTQDGAPKQPNSDKNVKHRDPFIRNRMQALTYTQVVIFALKEALNYDPADRKNSPPPELWLDDDEYLNEVRKLVSELETLNAHLKSRKSNALAASSVSRISKHFDKFLSSYAGTLGKGAARPHNRIGCGLLYQGGLGTEPIDAIWRHFKSLR